MQTSSASTLNQILAFSLRYPSACFHTIDMPYRLSSPAAQELANCRLWLDEAGELAAFAITQLPFSTLDWATRPGSEALHADIVDWGITRLTEIARQRGESFGYLLDSRSDQDQVAFQHGFVLSDWHIRNLALEFSQPPSPSSIPPGFQIRPLGGKEEVNAYVELHRAAFQSRNMSSEWRCNILGHPLYQPQLDLVAEDKLGNLAAFCIGWLGQIGNTIFGQIEPVGVLPAYQGQGLGRAILLESLARFYALGATSVHIDAESYNNASQHLYEAVGFREVTKTYKYFRRF